MEAGATNAIGLGVDVRRVLGFGLLALALCPLAWGCGGGVSFAHAKDAGSADAGDSGASNDAGDHGMIPRQDGQVSGSDPVPSCDRWNPSSCTAGKQCRVVIRGSAGATSFELYAGCVQGVPGRGLGEPCDQWGGMVMTYDTPGLTDQLYVDPCQTGLFCAPDPKVRDHFSCQQACNSGLESEATKGCASNQYCSGPQGYQEVCVDSDHCDPSDPASCGPGQGCYLRLNDTNDGVLTQCLPIAQMPVADGASCLGQDPSSGQSVIHLNICHAGSSCFGPARLPPSRWQDTDWVCRRSCSTSGTSASVETDAGSEEDGGTSVLTSRCTGAQACVGLSGSGLMLPSASSDLGQCE